jgi:hypothetical protein
MKMRTVTTVIGACHRELSPVRKEPTITGFIRQIVNIHDDRAI